MKRRLPSTVDASKLFLAECDARHLAVGVFNEYAVAALPLASADGGGFVVGHKNTFLKAKFGERGVGVPTDSCRRLACHSQF